MNYGKAIRISRATRRLTCVKLAALAKMDASYISLLESGKRTASPEALAAIVRALDVPRDVFDLLAAEEDDVRAMPEDQVQALGRSLLRLFVSADEPTDEPSE